MANQTASTPDAAAEILPVWDLTDLYPSKDSQVLTRDLDTAEQESQHFYEAYCGKLAGLDGVALSRAIAEYERIDEVLSRVMSFAGLTHAGDLLDPEISRFYQGMAERVTKISSRLLFFPLELNRLDDADLAAKIDAVPALGRYRPWLLEVRAFRPHQLSDEVERLLNDRSVVGRQAWNRLFDETIAGLRFSIEGQELSCSDALNLLTDTKGETRKAAAREITHVLGDNIRLFALVTNTLAKEKEIDDQWRNFARPVSSRNLANQVEDEVVDALVTAVKDAYPRLSHRYYALKAKWFGGEKLDYWDRNAPLPNEDDRKIGWGDARDLVLTAYGSFSPAMADVGRRFFDNAWIDAELRSGKSPGAFSHSTVPSAHPYILMNYHGRIRDVMTLAHELGHGVHQVMAADQGHLLSQTPLTLAETASVFGEMLTFQAVLRQTTDPVRRQTMLAAKVEDMLNTVVRQIAFYDFESRLHDARRGGELTAEEIGDIWLAVQGESLGPALRFDDGYRHWWAYIPHFIHTPFYVYAYAFGDCLVNALYAVYQDADAGFADRYLEMLAAGGTKGHKALLAPFGLDATDPMFWQKGLGLIAGFIDELEAADRPR